MPSLTSDPWPHRVLYWLGTGWWGLGLARASLPCMSKICLLLMRLPWLACTVSHSFFDYFMVPISFMACPAEGLGLAWRWALLFSPPFFLLPSSTIPLYYSCRLGLIGFLSICQLFSVRVAGLLLSTWASKMAINTYPHKKWGWTWFTTICHFFRAFIYLHCICNVNLHCRHIKIYIVDM